MKLSKLKSALFVEDQAVAMSQGPSRIFLQVYEQKVKEISTEIEKKKSQIEDEEESLRKCDKGIQELNRIEERLREIQRRIEWLEDDVKRRKESMGPTFPVASLPFFRLPPCPFIPSVLNVCFHNGCR